MRRHLSCALLTIILAMTAAVSAQPELDTTFNLTGKAGLGPGYPMGMAEDAAVQTDDAIVVVSGCSEQFSILHPFCLARFTASGQTDTTFGGTGFIRTDVPGTTQQGTAYGVAVQADGKIVVAGYVKFRDSMERGVIARYNANGSLDSGFGTGGVVIFDISGTFHDRATELAIQPDGKILIVGYSAAQTGMSEMFVARLSPNGTLDEAFGDGGIARTVVKGSSTAGWSIVIQHHGKILIGGNLITPTPSPGSTAYIIAQFNPDGSPDTTWDEDGIKEIETTALGPETPGINALAVQSNDRVVALGHGNTLYRLMPDGTLDTSFDTDGSRDALPGGSTPYDLALAPGGRIMVVGHNSYQPISFQVSLFRISRYLPDGAPDPTFSGDGFLEIDVVDVWTDAARAVALDSQGRAVVAGSSSSQMRFAPWIYPFYSVVRLVAPPAAANVGVSGRVIRPDGRPVANAFLTIEGSDGETGVALTSPFGYYHFANIVTGQNYIISARAKGLYLAPRQVFVGSEITGLDFISAVPK